MENKQIFHAFLFNIRNYSLDAKRSWILILPRVNNFDVKHKRAWNIFFIICHPHQTISGKIKTNKTQQISVKTQVLICKNWTRAYLSTTLSNHFILFLLILFSEIISPWKINRIRIFLTWNWQLIRDWRAIKHDSHLWIYDVTTIDVRCYNNWRYMLTLQLTLHVDVTIDVTCWRYMLTLQQLTYDVTTIDARSNMIHIYEFMMLQQLTLEGCNNFNLFNLGNINLKLLRACDMLSSNIDNYLIKRQSERFIIINI